MVTSVLTLMTTRKESNLASQQLQVRRQGQVNSSILCILEASGSNLGTEISHPFLTSS
jgi:hypothetical protein